MVEMKKKLKSIFGHNIMNLLRRIKYTFFPHLSEESKEIIAIRQKFYNSFIKTNELIFDIGANIGNRTRPLLNIGAEVVAVEPQKIFQIILKRKFGNKIKIVPMGLGEIEEIKDFFISDAHTLSSFSKEWIESVKEGRFKDCTWAKPIKIKITTLDKLIEKYGLPKFIKIDVEGYELEVLKGLTCAVDMISFEYTVPEQIQRAIDCISQIEKYNSEIECNFSKGESMEFALNNWVKPTDLKNYISTREFISTSFGDIYVRKIG
jgi:FkbM family methyltransferase